MTLYEKTIRATPIDKVDWERVTEHVESQDLSISFIREYADYLNWNKISYYKHTINFYREFADRFNWWDVSQSEINERKIKEFKFRFIDEWDWEELCKHSNLSKKFIMRNTELVNWDRIFTYQDNLGKQFMIDNQDRFSDDIDIDITFRNWGIKREKSVLL